jgi:predicted dehydrogenase
MTHPLRIGLLGASRIAVGAVIGPVGNDPRFAISAGYDALIRREDVDVVYNALPPAGHAQWSIAALAAGKAVLCEKPFARDAREARAMVEAASGAGRPLLEAFHYRFHRVIREAEAIVREGRLGRLRRAEARFEVTIAQTPGELRWSREQGGGALMDLGTYPLHALRTLIGSEPRIIGADAQFVDGVDARLEARLAFEGGVSAQIACSMTHAQPVARLLLEGDLGALEIVNFVAPQLGCRFSLRIDGHVETRPTDGPATYAAQLDHLFEVMSGSAAPLTGGQDAIDQMRAIDAIYAAAGRP